MIFSNHSEAFHEYPGYPLDSTIQPLHQSLLAIERSRGTGSTPTGMKFGLPDATIQMICAVLARYPQVESAVLYGSRAKGNYKTGSDIDLTLYGGASLTLDAPYKIMNELDDLLLPYTIGLSIFANISDPDVIKHIQRVGVVLCEKSQFSDVHFAC